LAKWDTFRPMTRLPATALPLLLASLLIPLSGCSPLLYVVLGGSGSGEEGIISVGQTVSSSTNGSDDDIDLDCGSADDSGDDTWTFVPPSTGTYRIHVDAGYDATLGIFRGDINGDSLGCNDDFESTASSRLVVALEAGQRYSIVVDGYDGAEGSYSLSVTQETGQMLPPPIDPPQPGTPQPEDAAAMAARCQQAPVLDWGVVQGTLVPTVAGAALSCGAGGRGADVVYRVDVTRPGTVQINETSEFDAVLELRAGCSQGHEVIACVDDAPDVRHSAITSHVAPGAYFLIVDSYSPDTGGPFTLEVSFIPD